ncbi:MAG: putative rane protein [Acidobacteria bacterium]|jgi:transporter family protein|nr:putative rane protein [Acidobacteriota bacterium]
MRPLLLALATAAAWGIGGYFEKKGLHAGNLSPQVGAFLRTAVALAVLGLASGPELRQLAGAPPRALWSIAIGGGIAAGGLGILCFYAALRAAPIQQVMPIAFTSPLFGALTAMALGGETISVRSALGMLLTLAGIGLIASR